MEAKLSLVNVPRIFTDKQVYMQSFCEAWIAQGGCYEKECRNIRMALRIADERMYEDKRRFYEEHPEIPISGKREYMEKV